MDRLIFVAAYMIALYTVALLIRDGYSHLTLAVLLLGIFITALYAGRVTH